MPSVVLSALPVLRGILAISPLPGAGGDYAGDLEHLKDWHPSMVIALTTTAELTAVGAENLRSDVVSLGTRWVHVSVQGFDVPDLAGNALWHGAAPMALSALRGGGRVLLHCRCGCDRSGMAALRLMIAAGESSEAALARLRRIRPCAIATSAQMRWSMRVVADE